MRLTPDEIKEMQALPRWNEFRQISDKVRKHAEDLARAGVSLDDGSMLVARMEAILDAVLPRTSAERLDFEIKWQEQIADALKDGEAAYHKARLQGMTAPRQTGSGLVLPNG